MLGSIDFPAPHWSVRFTDAVSNLGWSAAINAVIVQSAERTNVDRAKIFMTQRPILGPCWVLFTEQIVPHSAEGDGEEL